MDCDAGRAIDVGWGDSPTWSGRSSQNGSRCRWGFAPAYASEIIPSIHARPLDICLYVHYIPTYMLLRRLGSVEKVSSTEVAGRCEFRPPFERPCCTVRGRGQASRLAEFARGYASTYVRGVRRSRTPVRDGMRVANVVPSRLGMRDLRENGKARVCVTCPSHAGLPAQFRAAPVQGRRGRTLVRFVPFHPHP